MTLQELIADHEREKDRRRSTREREYLRVILEALGQQLL